MPEILTKVTDKLEPSSLVERRIPEPSGEARSVLENHTIYAVPDIIGAAVEIIRDSRGQNGKFNSSQCADAGDVLASIIEHGLSRIDQAPAGPNGKVRGKWNIDGRREAEISKDAQERMLRALDAIHAVRNESTFSLPTNLMLRLQEVMARRGDPNGCDIKAIECLGRSMNASPALMRLLGDPNESDVRRLACADAVSSSTETFVIGKRADILKDPRSNLSPILAERLIASMAHRDFEERSALVIFAANQADRPRLQLAALGKLHHQDRLTTDEELSAVARIINDSKSPHAACRAAVAAVQEGVEHVGLVRSLVEYGAATTDLELKARITRKLVGSERLVALQFFASIVGDPAADLYSVHAALQGIKESHDPSRGIVQEPLKKRAAMAIREDGPQGFQFDIKVMAYEALAVGSREWVISRLDDPESSAQDLVGAIMALAKSPTVEDIKGHENVLLEAIDDFGPDMESTKRVIPVGSAHFHLFPELVTLETCLNSIVVNGLRPRAQELSSDIRNAILNISERQDFYPKSLGFEVLGKVSPKNGVRETEAAMNIVQLEKTNWFNWGLCRFRKWYPDEIRAAAVTFLINSRCAPPELLTKAPDLDVRLLMLRSLDPQIPSVAKIIRQVAKRDPNKTIRLVARRILLDEYSNQHQS